MKKLRKNNKGFSLVELIVVIAIMAVLVGVLAPQFIKYVESSRQSTDIQNVQQLKTAIEVWASDNEASTAITITVDASAKTAVSSQDPETMDDTVQLKSATWQDCVYTFTPSTGTWALTSGASANTGGTNPKDLDSIF